MLEAGRESGLPEQGGGAAAAAQHIPGGLSDYNQTLLYFRGPLII